MRINNKVIKNEIHSDNLSFQVLNSGDFLQLKI